MGDWALEQIVQTGCGLSLTGDIQETSGCNPFHVIWDDFAWAGRLDQPDPFCDYHTLLVWHKVGRAEVWFAGVLSGSSIVSPHYSFNGEEVWMRFQSRHTLSVHRGKTGGGFWSHTVSGPHNFYHCVSSTSSVKRETSSVIVCASTIVHVVLSMYRDKANLHPKGPLQFTILTLLIETLTFSFLSFFPTPGAGADMAVAPDNFHMLCSTSFLNPSSHVSDYRRQREEMHKGEKKKAEAPPCHVM